ncbi:hypothetical protein COOONC_03490 [Cooperia oncophora]
MIEDITLLQTLYAKRLKIYFILVETYTTFTSDVFGRFSSLAIKSGGGAFRMKDYTSVRKFFGNFFGGIVGSDMVSYKPFNYTGASNQYIETDSFSVSNSSHYSALLVSPNGSSLVTKAALYSAATDKEVEVCTPEAAGDDLTLVDHVPAMQRDGCLFPFVLSYEWWCSKPNGVFQVQVDSTIGTTNITRTQILTCIDKGGPTCIHGKPDPDGNCVCDLGWGGPNCLTRICQNGGKPSVP